MRSPADMSCIQIEITNKCTHKCANCTRFVGHHSNTYFMDLDQVEQAIDSLHGFQGTVGIMGGEPTLHPRFLEILEILRDREPIEKRQLWTSGYKWKEYHEEINRTFLPENISYNDHSGDLHVRHQPLLVAIDEVVDDKELMFQFIDNCWIQNRWSASINTNGAFVCEVMAAMSYMFDMEGGLDVRPDWWKIKPGDDRFTYQILDYCTKCSGCLPLPGTFFDNGVSDLVSPINYKKIKDKSKKPIAAVPFAAIKSYLNGKTAEPSDERGGLKDFPEWHPWIYRNEERHEPKY